MVRLPLRTASRSRGRRALAATGNARIRKALYMPAMVALAVQSDSPSFRLASDDCA